MEIVVWDEPVDIGVAERDWKVFSEILGGCFNQ